MTDRRCLNNFKRIRGQRGDADPLLTIGAMVATLIVSAAIVGSVVALLNTGGKFTSDQVNATNMTTARDAFAADAQNATAVSAVSNSSVRFTQNPSGSAITSDRGTNGKTCRVSDWSSVKETNGSYTLVNKVWKTAWDATAKTCAAPVAGKERVALSVTGFPAAPTLTYANAAGAAVTFTAAGAGSTPARPAGSYYTAEEWGSWTPKTVILTGQMGSKTSGTKPSTLIGVTNLKEVHSALAPLGNEPKPTREVFDPAPPRIVSVVRSKSVGALFANQREGLSVAWDGVFCGPYTVRYDVTYKPTTPGVATQTFSVTTYDVNITHDFDRIPNGARGTISVTATCPKDVSTKPATSQKAFDQGLPAPVLTNRVLTADIHQLDWTGGLSSLPLNYVPFAKHSTQPSWAYSAPSTASNTMNWQWLPGYTYGVSNYMVRASVTGGLTADSNRSDATVAWPGPAPTNGVWSSNTGGPVFNNTLNWGGITCWPGTRPQYNPVFSGVGQGWRTSLSLRVGVRYATTYSGGVQTQCASPFEVSPVGSATTSWRTNDPPPPVPSAPSVGGTYLRGASGGGATTINVSGSAYATSYEFGSRLFVSDGAGPWSSQTASSPGIYVGNTMCGTPKIVTGAAARARAGGVSGWSGYNSAALNQVGGRFSCN